MKKVFYFFAISMLLGFMSCSSDDDLYFDSPKNTAEGQGSSGSLKTLENVTDPSISSVTTLNLTKDLLTDGKTTTGGMYWKDTYTPNTKIVSGIFTFSHSSMFSGYNYWDGFTVSNVNDITNYGTPGSSDGWVAHQWGCMPGSGANTANSVKSGTPGISGDPFIVAYWSSYMDPKNPVGMTFSESTFSNWIKIGNNGQYLVKGLKIANHPWPYYGNLKGDGFAQPLDKVGDFFTLYIYGVDTNNKISSNRVAVSLAKNEKGGITNLVQNAQWITVEARDLAKLGKNVKYLVFQMASSDSDPMWGMNTAAYFCLDKLQVQRIK